MMSVRREINLSPIFEALEQPLGLVDDPERRAEMKRIADAGRIYQERAIYDLLSEVVTAFNEAGSGARVRLEYESGGVHLAVEAESDDEAVPVLPMSGEMERVTVRLPAGLKAMIDEAASLRGLSVNSWYVRALARAAMRQLHGELPGQPRGSHRGGWGRRGRLAVDDAGGGPPST
jgi:hypothetical protein